MKRALLLLCCTLGPGCSAADPGGAGSGGSPAAAGSVSHFGGSSSGGGGTAASGTGGSAATAGSQASSGAPSDAGSGGNGNGAGMTSIAGSSGNGGSDGGGAGTAGGAGTGAGGANACAPDAGGALSIVGDTVHDSKTCLDWMKTTKTGVNYAAAETFCGDATMGGFDDWRIPTASEFASTITLCGKYPPDGPNDTKFFDQQGDGYWTSTPAGELNKVCAVGMLNAGGYYHYGTAGPQVVRCVRGTGSVNMVKDCTAAQGCTSW